LQVQRSYDKIISYEALRKFCATTL